MLHEEIRFQRVGVIVVKSRPFFQAKIQAVPVIAIMLEDADLFVSDALRDALHHGRLAGARPARNPDHEGAESVSICGTYGIVSGHRFGSKQPFSSSVQSAVRTSGSAGVQY